VVAFWREGSGGGGEGEGAGAGTESGSDSRVLDDMKGSNE